MATVRDLSGNSPIVGVEIHIDHEEGGAAGGASLAVVETTAPTLVDQAEEELRLNTKGGLRSTIYDEDGTAIDFNDAAITEPHAATADLFDATITITASTAAADLIAAAGASTYADILSVTLMNNDADNGTEVQILNADGTTVRWSGYVPQGDMRGIVFPVPLLGAAANAKWQAKTVTSTSSVKITVQYRKRV